MLLGSDRREQNHKVYVRLANNAPSSLQPMWRLVSSRSRPCLALQVLLVVLAASLVSVRCSAPGKDHAASAAGPAPPATDTLQGKGEQDLLKWALCE